MNITTAAHTITQTEINQFAALTGDNNPIHLDEDVAREGIFGRIVAHGLLVHSLALGLAVEHLNDTLILAFRSLDVKFTKPVYPNDTIRVEMSVAETKAVRRLNAVWLTLAFNILNDNDDVVQSGNWEILQRVNSEG